MFPIFHLSLSPISHLLSRDAEKENVDCSADKDQSNYKEITGSARCDVLKREFAQFYGNAILLARLVSRANRAG